MTKSCYLLLDKIEAENRRKYGGIEAKILWNGGWISESPIETKRLQSTSHISVALYASFHVWFEKSKKGNCKVWFIFINGKISDIFET